MAFWPARRPALILVVMAGILTTLGAGDATAPPPHRHPSGLWILPESDQPGVPAQLDERYGAYDTLGQAFPDDVGYVHVDAGKLVVDVASDKGEDLADRMVAGQPMPAPAPEVDPYDKLKAVLDEKSRAVRGQEIVLRRVERSRSAVQKIADGVIDFANDPALADAGIWQTVPDPVTGRVVVWMTQLTDATAAAIVGAYGAEAVVVIEEPNPGLGEAPA